MLTSVKYRIHAKMGLSAGTRLEATNAFASQDLEEKTVKQVNNCIKKRTKFFSLSNFVTSVYWLADWLID